MAAVVDVISKASSEKVIQAGGRLGKKNVAYPFLDAVHPFVIAKKNATRKISVMNTLATSRFFLSAGDRWTPQVDSSQTKASRAEIEYHVKKFGARGLPFQDLTAIIQNERIVQFCQELLDRELHISWQFPSGTRTEAIEREVAELMRQTGMVSIAYAPESL